jgi:hypothetical protein
VLLPAALLGLSLGGLPFTGVALAKLAVKSSLGAGWVGALGALAAAGTTLLMLHFLLRLADTGATQTKAKLPLGLVLPWLAMALAGFKLPWLLYHATKGGALADMLAPGALWATLWQVLLGLVLAVLLHRWRHRLPRVPEGDLVAVVESAARAAIDWSKALERAKGHLRQWSVAGLSLLSVAIILGAAMLAGP